MDIYILQKALIKWADAHGVIPLQSFANFVFVLHDRNAKRAAMVADMKKRKKEVFLKSVVQSLIEICIDS